MLSFSSSLSPDCEAFAIFVDEKSNFNDKKNILKTDISTKIRSYLKVLKDKKNESEIFSLDISTKQKCFLIKLALRLYLVIVLVLKIMIIFEFLAALLKVIF